MPVDEECHNMRKKGKKSKIKQVEIVGFMLSVILSAVLAIFYI